MNKNLFKGALVLFASILMAVSCSNNSTGGGNDGNGGGTTGEKQDIAITLPETTAANTRYLIKAKAADGDLGAKSATEITLTGDDKSDNKVSVSVTGIENTLTVDPSNSDVVSSGTWKKISDVSPALATSDFVASKAGDKVTINFANKNAANKIIGSGKKLATDKHFGIVKLTLTFSYENDEKKSITKDVWVALAAVTDPAQ